MPKKHHPTALLSIELKVHGLGWLLPNVNFVGLTPNCFMLTGVWNLTMATMCYVVIELVIKDSFDTGMSIKGRI